MNRLTRTLVPTALLAASAVQAFAQEYSELSFVDGYVVPPTGTTVVHASNRDDETAEVTLPFEFPFFGRLHTRASVCTNGWLALGSTTVRTSGNAVLPTAAQPNGIVAAVWDDLTTGTAGRVQTFVEGTEPTRVLVVAWTSMDAPATPAVDGVSFQVRLHEGTGVVEIVYDGANGAWDGLSFTSGIEDPSGTRAFGAGSLDNTQTGAPTLDWRFDPKIVTVTGTLLRDRPVAGTTGLGQTTESGLPVAGADLLLVREDTAETAARGTTAGDGTFAVTVLGADLPTTFEARVLASSPEVRVLDAAGTVYSFVFAQGIAADGAPALGTTSLDAAVDTVDGAIRRALNIQQAVRRGIVRAGEAAEFAGPDSVPPEDAETFPRLDARWNPGAAAADGRTAYVLATFTPATPTTPEVRTPPILRIHDAADNPDPWDDDVLLRETALHVFATISRLDTTLPGHTWDAVSAADRAFVDGVSHWFACALQDRPQFIDTTSATAAVVRDLETLPDTIVRQPDITANVAASLWDLVDPAGEARDDFAGTRGPTPSTIDEVLKTIDRDLDAPAATPNVRAFFDAWAASRTVAGEAEATSRIFIRYGTLPDDAREPNDLAGEETAVAGPAAKVDPLTLSPFNEDRFAVAFGGDGTQPLLVTVGLTAQTEIDVEVLAPGGGMVAAATNVGSPTTARVVAQTAGPAPAGTYTVRVVWRDGPTSAYTLAFHEPVRVTPATLGEWTSGFPFAQSRDFEPAGGLPPYVLTLSDLPPGLSASVNGRRLVGTPTVEGAYEVLVDVTDATGPGVAATQTVPLVVNPPLRLAEWFGTVSGAALAADVGTGGTSADWTVVGAPPPGFDATGGPTFHVESMGAVVDPEDTFDVTASAVDAAGAEVPRGDAHVVVCPVLPAKGSAAVPKPRRFGFWFDAFADAQPNLRFQFSGKGATPRLAALVDDAGREVDLTGRTTVSGKTVRLRGARLPTTGRWFAIFEKTESRPFAGRVSAAGHADVPREVHGVVVIDMTGQFEIVSFEASAGSKARLLVRAEEVPRKVHPVFGDLQDPGGAVADKGRREERRRGEVVEHPSARLGATGTWTLQIGAESSPPQGVPSTGPIFFRVKVKPPSGGSFDLFGSN